eukprot:5870856-Prymnesium_polylepis.1
MTAAAVACAASCWALSCVAWEATLALSESSSFSSLPILGTPPHPRGRAWGQGVGAEAAVAARERRPARGQRPAGGGGAGLGAW